MKDQNIEIRKCNCGSKIKLSLMSRSDYGSAVIQCLSCTISMSESSNSLGYDDTLDSLKHRALYKWNTLFKNNDFQIITFNGVNCYE